MCCCWFFFLDWQTTSQDIVNSTLNNCAHVYFVLHVTYFVLQSYLGRIFFGQKIEIFFHVSDVTSGYLTIIVILFYPILYIFALLRFYSNRLYMHFKFYSWKITDFKPYPGSDLFYSHTTFGRFSFRAHFLAVFLLHLICVCYPCTCPYKHPQTALCGADWGE